MIELAYEMQNFNKISRYKLKNRLLCRRIINYLSIRQYVFDYFARFEVGIVFIQGHIYSFEQCENNRTQKWRPRYPVCVTPRSKFCNVIRKMTSWGFSFVDKT